MDDASPSATAFRRVLVIKLKHLGDVLLTTPVIRALKLASPECEITVCLPAGTEEILAGNRLVNSILPVRRGSCDEGKLARWLRELKFARMLRNKRFDVVLDLTTSDRSAVITRITGAPIRVGYRSLKGFFGRASLYTNVVQAEHGEHIVEKQLRLLQPLGIPTAGPSLDFPLEESDRVAVQKLIPKDKPLLQVHPVSRVERKNWQVSFMAELVNSIAKQGFTPVITGSAAADEKHWISELLARLTTPAINLSGKLTLRQLGALSEQARCFVGVDTAPMHIAAAVGTPVIALFGPSSERLWAPICEHRLILSRDDLDCRSPCKDKHCAHIACLNGLRPEMVVSRVRQFLRELPKRDM
jgi:heptosyltransferase-3